jgi:hypothetical protein
MLMSTAHTHTHAKRTGQNLHLQHVHYHAAVAVLEESDVLLHALHPRHKIWQGTGFL